MAGLWCSYAGNQTSTRKYSWWSFIPLALFVQYQRAAYWYFTAMAGLSLAPFAPYSAVSVWLPLIFVLLLGLLREAWEDLRRARGDKELNNRSIEVHDGTGKFVERRWKDLRVGDLVRVKDSEYFPSDLLVISSSGPDGICYVETMNLDGETNLKVRNISLKLPNSSHSVLGFRFQTTLADIVAENCFPGAASVGSNMERRRERRAQAARVSRGAPVRGTERVALHILRPS